MGLLTELIDTHAQQSGHPRGILLRAYNEIQRLNKLRQKDRRALAEANAKIERLESTENAAWASAIDHHCTEVSIFAEQLREMLAIGNDMLGAMEAHTEAAVREKFSSTETDDGGE